MKKIFLTSFISIVFGCSTPCEQSVQDMKTCLEAFDKAYPEAETEIDLDVEEECSDQDEVPTEFYECISEAASDADCSSEDGFLAFFMETWDCASQHGMMDEEVDPEPEEVIEADAYEPDNTADTATPFTVGESQERTLHEYGELDFVSFSATAGTTYILETRIDSTASTDTYLKLYDENAYMLAENDDNIDLESLIEWTAVVDGTYFLAVEEYGYTGPYTLQITEN